MAKQNAAPADAVDQTTGELQPTVTSETFSAHLTAGLGAAMVAVQRAMKPAQPSATGHVGKEGARAYQYANLADVTAALQDLMGKNDLFVTHLPQATDGTCVRLLTYVVHAPSCGWLMSEIVLTPASPTPQNIGSTMTYARRYGLSAMMGVVVEDDDAASASQGQAARPAAKSPTNGRSAAAAAPADGKPPKASATHEQLVEIKNLLQTACGEDAAAKRALYHEVADFTPKGQDKVVAAPDDTKKLSTGWAGNVIKSLRAYCEQHPAQAAENENQDAVSDYTAEDLEDDSIPF